MSPSTVAHHVWVDVPMLERVSLGDLVGVLRGIRLRAYTRPGFVARLVSAGSRLNAAEHCSRIRTAELANAANEVAVRSVERRLLVSSLLDTFEIMAVLSGNAASAGVLPVMLRESFVHDVAYSVNLYSLYADSLMSAAVSQVERISHRQQLHMQPSLLDFRDVTTYQDPAAELLAVSPTNFGNELTLRGGTSIWPTPTQVTNVDEFSPSTHRTAQAVYASSTRDDVFGVRSALSEWHHSWLRADTAQLCGAMRQLTLRTTRAAIGTGARNSATLSDLAALPFGDATTDELSTDVLRELLVSAAHTVNAYSANDTASLTDFGQLCARSIANSYTAPRSAHCAIADATGYGDHLCYLPWHDVLSTTGANAAASLSAALQAVTTVSEPTWVVSPAAATAMHASVCRRSASD